MERLQKIMASSGVASRRKSEKIIAGGRVRVNGEVVTRPGTRVSEDDFIEVDGRVIKREKKIYILLNKPPGYITTVDDPHGRKTVLNLVKGVEKRIYPVGRLDIDTEGLLLLTNDGELTFILTHPSHKIDKSYRVTVEGKPGPKALKRLEEGVLLEDGRTAPAGIDNICYRNNYTYFDIRIHEGRNRQVRRMCNLIGFPVINLRRFKFAFLTLKGLGEGEYRFLTEEEVQELKKLK